MEQYIQHWQETADHKALFLRTYLLMTRNVLLAIDQQQFHDSAWVNKLLHHFAHYYFIALEQYEHQPASSPKVWQVAHNAAYDDHVSAFQKILLGMNAHINYDLVLALVDLLQPEWEYLSRQQRERRYADHCHINDIIGRTIDTVQNDILNPAMPILYLVDKVMGPLDEFLLSRLIAYWRNTVWQNAVQLLETADPQQRTARIQQLEQATLITGKFICQSY